MSDTITLGKRRKDGAWIVLVQPEKPFGDHLDAYRKIASNHPVSDEYVKVVIGKLHHSSPALTLVSSSEAAAKAKADKDRIDRVNKIVATADERKADQAKEANEAKAIEHAEIIAEKNAMINRIRQDSNQATIDREELKKKKFVPPPKEPETDDVDAAAKEMLKNFKTTKP